jgi:hypothetical protein
MMVIKPKHVGVFFQPAYISAANMEGLLPEAVLIQFVSPDDEHDVINRNKYIKNNLCIMLDIYQESCRSCFNVNYNIILKQLYCASVGK